MQDTITASPEALSLRAPVLPLLPTTDAIHLGTKHKTDRIKIP